MIGGRKTNKTLKSWVAFVKKVQKEENISYKEAMSRAKARKKEWQHGGEGEMVDETVEMTPSGDTVMEEETVMEGGRRRRRTKRRAGSRRHRRTARRSRRHR